MGIQELLLLIAALLFLILWRVSNIDTRLKERFPTEKEEDHQWALKDPMGHAEAHKDEYEK